MTFHETDLYVLNDYSITLTLSTKILIANFNTKLEINGPEEAAENNYF